ncbi:nitroreductase family deazaflavin-dependent oxidoreductase [Antrihabitans sp. YC3-6]|uniref:Nitroreductase family deazaflavin-dependent oxidoreductase n=1 Tax=Antrihabitans stalagmiti TaxID=2799499 RepID=A0A934U636_9NOCA|nr:nitroreductase family deazaflavin-dependent oxidoreductase [Antrihabitans stalagmiti]MBJ8342002.1 nitroreductase family deazaflavin-dependent oxidoreductase [Antrihabitans stalagmiti]
MSSARNETRAFERKFRIERALERAVNPVVIAMRHAGIRSRYATELETTGRKTGLLRSVVVTAKFDDAGAWVISQHGTRSGWGANITTHPRVRIRQGKAWRTGTAVFDHTDDVVARARSFGSNPVASALSASAVRSVQTTPITVRITFDD